MTSTFKLTALNEADQPTLDRILQRVELGPGGCLLWQGPTNDAGYASVGHRRMHRYVYELVNGPIPRGAVLDHTCHGADPDCPGGVTDRHRRCLRPDHLEPVDRRTNIYRSHVWRANGIEKKSCPVGHPYDEANTRVRGSKRSCRRCHTERARIRRAQDRDGVLFPID